MLPDFFQPVNANSGKRLDALMLGRRRAARRAQAQVGAWAQVRLQA